MRIPLTALIIAGGLAVSGCAYGSFGRYGGVSVGYGSGYGSYGGYGYPYGSYGSLYGSPYYGWYDGFYYPGTGFYVYDRYRRPFIWSDRYRRYWTDRREAWRQRTGDRSLNQAIWTAFDRRRAARTVSVQRQSVETPAVQAQSRPRLQRAERASGRDRDRPNRRTRADPDD